MFAQSYLASPITAKHPTRTKSYCGCGSGSGSDAIAQRAIQIVWMAKQLTALHSTQNCCNTIQQQQQPNHTIKHAIFYIHTYVHMNKVMHVCTEAFPPSVACIRAYNFCAAGPQIANFLLFYTSFARVSVCE